MKIIFQTLLLIVALLIGNIGCQNESNNFASQLPTTEELIELFNIPIPSNSKVLFYKKDSGLDEYHRVKLIMPRDSFIAWLRILNRTPDHFEANHNFLFTDSGNWQPSKESDLKSAQITFTDRANALNIGYTLEPKANEAVIYLVYHDV